jgi:hypothetical protein
MRWQSFGSVINTTILDKLSVLLLCVCLLCASANAQSACCAQITATQYESLQPGARALLSEIGIRAANFALTIDAINQQTQARLLEGEMDHLIFFALQSRRFTSRAAIEPALSAYQLVAQLTPEEKARCLNTENKHPPCQIVSARIPEAEAARLREFTQALRQKSDDERIQYFQNLPALRNLSDRKIYERVSAEYLRAMTFLYRKEFAAKSFLHDQEAAAYVAALYQQRGHSTDTQVEAGFAIHEGLAAVSARLTAEKSEGLLLDNVLIIGPGMDFAPRTDLLDWVPPQSYQPFAVADSLLKLKLVAPDRLRIDCVDINPRVVDFLNDFARRNDRKLALVSGLADRTERPLSAGYKNYFAQLGLSIGQPESLRLPIDLRAHSAKLLRVEAAIAGRIHARQMNVVTQRCVNAAPYDLVIVTNVFPYFSSAELALALSNIAAMLREGGLLLHNESRPELASLAQAAGVPAIQSRTVLIAGAQKNSLFDGVAIHQKSRIATSVIPGSAFGR